MLLREEEFPLPNPGEEDLIQAALYDTLRLLRSRGWCQRVKHFEGRIDLVCALTAICDHYRDVAEGDPFFANRPWSLRVEIDALIEGLINPSVPGVSIVKINDTLCSTFADIEELLGVAIETYRPGDRPYTKERLNHGARVDPMLGYL